MEKSELWLVKSPTQETPSASEAVKGARNPAQRRRGSVKASGGDIGSMVVSISAKNWCLLCTVAMVDSDRDMAPSGVAVIAF